MTTQRGNLVDADRNIVRKDPIQIMFHHRIRKSPYFFKTIEYGAKAFSTYNHMYLPSYYSELENEYWCLLNNVVVWDVSVERIVEITGRDAEKFTNMLTPRDLTKCKIGQCKYVVICDKNGGILNDPVLSRLGKNHFWLALADSDILFWAKGVAQNSGMKVNIIEPDVSPLQVQGPKSQQLVYDLFGDQINGMKYYDFIETDLDGIPLVLTRTGYTGEMGFELYLRDGSRGEELWDRVFAAGEPYSVAPAGPCNIRRIEAGMLSWGFDMTVEDNPFQVYEPEMLRWLVNLDQKADFIGKEALQRIKTRGVRRKLVGVEIYDENDEKIMSARHAFEKRGWQVSRHGKIVGDLRSMAYSPWLGKNIGYAMVPSSCAKLGTGLTMHTPSGNTLKATVVKKPFVDPRKIKPKS